MAFSLNEVRKGRVYYPGTVTQTLTCPTSLRLCLLLDCVLCAFYLFSARNSELCQSILRTVLYINDFFSMSSRDKLRTLDDNGKSVVCVHCCKCTVRVYNKFINVFCLWSSTMIVILL